MKRTLAALLMALAAVLGVTAPAVLDTAPAAEAIVGGIDAVENPGVVSLWTQTPYRNRCSGTLLDDGTPADGTKWVLTAGHCVYSITYPPAGPVEARTGSVSNTSGYAMQHASKYYVHPGYNDITWTYDAMMIELVAPILPTQQKPVKWNGVATPAPGTIGTIQGYGWICDGPAGEQCSTWYVGNLKRMASKVLADTDCPAHMADPQYKVCYEEANGGYVMACPGDSGAPFLTKDVAGNFWHRLTIVGDADDQTAASCTTAPDGSNGLGMGTDTAAIWPWIGQVMAGQIPPTDTSVYWPPVNMTGRFIN